MRKPIYLDYAAATPMDTQVLKAMKPYFGNKFYNPSATYLAGRAVRQDLEKARESVAKTLGARPGEIIFTAGATEANNLSVSGVMNKFPQAELLVSAIEHDSVLAPAKNFNHKLIPMTKQGIVDLAKLKKLISAKTVLVSVMLVNNELGTIQPVNEIAKMLNLLSKSRVQAGNKLPLYLHTDVAQAGNYLDLHVSRLGADLLSLNGGKIYGPKQSGALYIKAGTQLRPLIVGGGQELGYRAGTENVAAIVGLAKALDLAQANRQAGANKTARLRNYFEQLIEDQVPGAVVNGSVKHKAPHILSVTLPSCDAERLMMQLDEAGVICAVGSACSAASDQPSHVLAAIGLSDAESHSTLRFSLGRFTKKSDITKTVRLLRQFYPD